MLRITCKFTPAPVAPAGTYSFDFNGDFSDAGDQGELLDGLATALGVDSLEGTIQVTSAVTTVGRTSVVRPAAAPAVPYTPVTPAPPLRPLSTPGYSPVSDGLRSRAG